MEYWNYFPDSSGKPTYKFYTEDKSVLDKLLQLSGVKRSAIYKDRDTEIVGWDVIVPAKRLNAVFKQSGLKMSDIILI